VARSTAESAVEARGKEVLGLAQRLPLHRTQALVLRHDEKQPGEGGAGDSGGELAVVERGSRLKGGGRQDCLPHKTAHPTSCTIVVFSRMQEFEVS
jgi:hypothetical protein